MPVTRQELVGPILRTLEDGQHIDWHDHARNQLIYPSRGVLEVSAGAGAWIVPPQRAVWIPAGVPHAHRAHGATHLRSLAFAHPVNPLRTRQPTVIAVTALLREVVVALTPRADPAGSPSRADRPRTPEQRRALEIVALDELARAEPLALLLPSPTDDRLRHITALLLADPADSRTLAALGAAVGASERTLSRLFAAQTGMSFPRWRAQLRLHHAVKLLAEGASVTGAGAASGYSGTSAFIEAFRQTFGTTPGRYRTGGS